MFRCFMTFRSDQIDTTKLSVLCGLSADFWNHLPVPGPREGKPRPVTIPGFDPGWPIRPAEAENLNSLVAFRGSACQTSTLAYPSIHGTAPSPRPIRATCPPRGARLPPHGAGSPKGVVVNSAVSRAQQPLRNLWGSLPIDEHSF